MSPNEIEAQRKQTPFAPFRIYLSDQSHFDIRHPEMLLVTRRVVYVAIYDSANTTMPERAIFCDPLHITRLEPINDLRSAPARPQ